jgi:hypothetical protein
VVRMGSILVVLDLQAWWGGGIAQIIAYTFGLNGVTLDAPGASAIVASKEYQVFITSLKEKYPNAFNNIEDTPNVGEHFINIREFYLQNQCLLNS